MRYGATGSSWNADRNTVNVNPHIRKKRGVKRRSSGIKGGEIIVRSAKSEVRSAFGVRSPECTESEVRSPKCGVHDVRSPECVRSAVRSSAGLQSREFPESDS